MFCSNCGKQINKDDKFCLYCGFKINTNSTEEVLDLNKDNNTNNMSINNNLQNDNNYNNANNNFNQFNMNNTFNNGYNYSEKKGLSGKQKGIIIGLLVLFLGVLLIACFSTSVFGNSNNRTRTIMIYIEGSNLESDAGIVTADLNGIDPSKINLKKTNILLYTGGTEKWHNFIRNDENAIYILKENGFEKVKSYPKKNMGDPSTFSEFLNFAYKNYKANVYNLVLYDHGGAIDGAIYDDFSRDNLSLADLSKGMKDSPFNKRNKLQSVLFRTCLNGTLEVGSVFDDYSDYLIASEEVTYGGPNTSVLVFLNNIIGGDSGVDFGKKFMNSYDEQMNTLDVIGQYTSTYSIVDLSKIDKVKEELNKFYAGIDVKTNYSNIARVRSSIYQYGSSVSYYDMVDLYDFTKGISQYSKTDSSKLLKAIDSAVVHNNTNLNTAHGISIYVPYKGNSMATSTFLSVYNKLDGFGDYAKFITSFNAVKNGQQPFSYNLSSNEFKQSDKEVSMKLTDEQAKNYSGAGYILFKKDLEHPDYYYLLYSSNDAELKDGYVMTKLSNKLIRIKDKSDKKDKGNLIPISRRVNAGTETIVTNGILIDSDKDVLRDGFLNNVDIHLAEKNGKPIFSTVTLSSDNKKVDGTLLDINDFDYLDLMIPRVKILDKNGKYTDNWETFSEKIGIEIKVKDIDLVNSSVDNDGEYYVVFFIKDINNNQYNSEPIRVK